MKLSLDMVVFWECVCVLLECVAMVNTASYPREVFIKSYNQSSVNQGQGCVFHTTHTPGPDP